MEAEVDFVVVEHALMEVSSIIEDTMDQLTAVIDFVDRMNDAKLRRDEELEVEAGKLLACVSATASYVDELTTRITTLQHVLLYLKKRCET
ncbi:hypothetical protein OSTOST_01608 [Ostertagia ostertagi]